MLCLLLLLFTNGRCRWMPNPRIVPGAHGSVVMIGGRRSIGCLVLVVFGNPRSCRYHMMQVSLEAQFSGTGGKAYTLQRRLKGLTIQIGGLLLLLLTNMVVRRCGRWRRSHHHFGKSTLLFVTSSTSSRRRRSIAVVVGICGVIRAMVLKGF